MTHNIADPYRDWDAAYVLGALAPAERQEFERHIAECPECSAAVAELAGLPGILGKLPVEEALSVGAGDARDGASATAAVTDRRLHDETGSVAAIGLSAGNGSAAASDTLRGLSARVRRIRMRSRVLAATVAVAACAASVGITLAVTGTDAGAGQSQPGQTQAAGTPLHFSAVTASSLTATGTLLPEPWGTRIDWSCTYAAHSPSAVEQNGPSEPDEPGGRYSPAPAEAAHGYALLVTDADGATTRVASWVAAPGSVVTPTATTRIRAMDIRRVEIRATATGRILLAATP